MTIEHYAGLVFWKSASETIQNSVQKILAQLVNHHGGELVESFYSAFMQHEEGRSFLNHDVVQNRLSNSMRHWLGELVAVDLNADLQEFSAAQARVGAIHGRMKVPNHLVHQGASLLKSHLSHLLMEHLTDQPELMICSIIIFDEMMDFALCLMSKAYVSDAQKRAQVDEAFRHFSLGQDINLERETQRAALMEWSQSILFDLIGNRHNEAPQRLSTSPFGLWMRHRAPVLFQDVDNLTAIERTMTAIDRECLPAIIEADNNGAALMQLKERIEEISFLLNNLFQAAAALESGRDPLTRTLSRRFLASVLNREISMAKAHSLPLCVAMIDVDHFKQVNDQHGHAAGDVALSHVADILLKSVRSNDFIFRYGGEEFLIVFPETTVDVAQQVMELLRQKLERHPVDGGDKGSFHVTLSAGISAFEGHPDYEYLIRNADSALYAAKRAGRNRIMVQQN